MNPSCSKCKSVSEVRWLVQTSFFFCPVCRDEVVETTTPFENELLKFMQENGLI